MCNAGLGLQRYTHALVLCVGFTQANKRCTEAWKLEKCLMLISKI